MLQMGNSCTAHKASMRSWEPHVVVLISSTFYGQQYGTISRYLRIPCIHERSSLY